MEDNNQEVAIELLYGPVSIWYYIFNNDTNETEIHQKTFESFHDAYTWILDEVAENLGKYGGLTNPTMKMERFEEPTYDRMERLIRYSRQMFAFDPDMHLEEDTTKEENNNDKN